MNIQQKLSDILKLNLPRKWTSVSYAIMVDGKLVAADALGQDGTKDKNPVTLNHTYNVCSKMCIRDRYHGAYRKSWYPFR